MKNIARELDTFDDEDFETIERFGRKPKFQDEQRRRKNRDVSYKRERQRKEKERQQWAEESESD